MKVKGMIVVLLALSTLAWARAKVEERTLQAQPGNVPAGAQIEKVNPLNVVPGTLIAVEGSGFGNTPRAIRVGNQTITTFIGWEDTAIFFRIPQAPQPGDRVIVGSATSPFPLQPAPEGSIRVQWTIDVSRVTDAALKPEERARLTGPLTFTPPLYIKGEWIKTNAASYGNREAAWDGGSRYRMVNASGTFWIAEAVFTPQNLATFRLPNGRPRPMKFAFEDGNLTRNLIEFESDWAYALKKQFAATDLFESIHSDPAIELTTEFRWFSREDNKIYAPFPTR